MDCPIFISYSRKDLSKAKQIKSEIESSTKATCWMDMDGIESGEQFEDVIISAIDNCQIVVFLLSESSMQSKWVKDEVRYAYETQKKVVPLKIDDSELKGWFLFKFSGNDVIMNDIFEQKEKLFKNLKSWLNIQDVPTNNNNVIDEAKLHAEQNITTNEDSKPQDEDTIEPETNIIGTNISSFNETAKKSPSIRFRISSWFRSTFKHEFTDEYGAIYRRWRDSDQYANTLASLPKGMTGDYYIREGTTHIAHGAFNDCNLSKLIIPSSITAIKGDNVFKYAKIETVEFEEGIEIIGNDVFRNSCTKYIKFPSSLKCIGAGAFYGSSLCNVTFNEGLETIGDKAFCNCFDLIHLQLPNTLTKIGQEAFYSWELKKEEVTIPDSVTEWGKDAIVSKVLYVPAHLYNIVKEKQSWNYDTEIKIKK